MSNDSKSESTSDLLLCYAHRISGYYYQYNYNHLGVCKLTLHALLHVADDVPRCGPAWVSWSFSIERYCREVTTCTRSKLVPYSTINKHVLQMAQLSAAAMHFSDLQKALLFGKADAPVDVSAMERVYNKCEFGSFHVIFSHCSIVDPHTILHRPCVKVYTINVHA